MIDYADFCKQIYNNKECLMQIHDENDMYWHIHTLIKSVELNNYELVKLYFNLKLRVVKGIMNNALMSACIKNHEKIAFYLINKGADINYLNIGKCNALHWTCFNNNIKLSKLLIKRKINVNAVNEKQLTPIHYSCTRSIEITKLLIDHGANINFLDTLNESPIFCAIREREYDIVKLLIDSGADVNIKNNNNSIILHLVCHIKDKDNDNNFKFAKLFIDRGSDVNVINNFKTNPLILACDADNFETAKLLIDHGSDVNVINVHKATGLILACINNNYELAKLLIDKGANRSLAKTYAKDDLLELFQDLEAFNTIRKKCVTCRNISDFNILAYNNETCLICHKDDVRVYVFKCGHMNCCAGCFAQI